MDKLDIWRAAFCCNARRIARDSLIVVLCRWASSSSAYCGATVQADKTYKQRTDAGMSPLSTKGKLALPGREPGGAGRIAGRQSRGFRLRSLLIFASLRRPHESGAQSPPACRHDVGFAGFRGASQDILFWGHWS